MVVTVKTIDTLHYNYGENVWYYGTLSRSAFMDRGVNQYPIGARRTDIYITTKLVMMMMVSAMTASLESSPMDVGEGERMVFINRIIPDFTFQGSSTAEATSCGKYDIKYARLSR